VTERFVVPVRLFGRHRELAGAAELSVELAVGGTVGDVKQALAAHPGLSGPQSFAIAVNRRYEPDDSPVTEGDEVAVIPPVAGG